MARALPSDPTMRRSRQKFYKSFKEYDANPATVYSSTISQFTSSYKEDKEEVITENEQKNAGWNEVKTMF
eukprot:3202283-Ditylum_brightwellii.AAC.1